MKSYGKDGYKPNVAINDAVHAVLRGEQSGMRKLLEVLDGSGAAYKAEGGVHRGDEEPEPRGQDPRGPSR